MLPLDGFRNAPSQFIAEHPLISFGALFLLGVGLLVWGGQHFAGRWKDDTRTPHIGLFYGSFLCLGWGIAGILLALHAPTALAVGIGAIGGLAIVPVVALRWGSPVLFLPAWMRKQERVRRARAYLDREAQR